MRVDGELSESFLIGVGLRLLFWLLSILMDGCMRNESLSGECRCKTKIKWNGVGSDSMLVCIVKRNFRECWMNFMVYVREEN